MTTFPQARVTVFTHQGLHRDHNEDTVAEGCWIRNAPMEHPRQTTHLLNGSFFCLVADGMGGQAAGGEASRFAVSRLVSATDQTSGEDGIVALLRQVNREIFDAMREDPRRLGMGTTIAGLLVAHDAITWFNLGDSRIYRYRDGFLRQLSIHDVPSHDADRRKRSHRVTQALGGAEDFVDVAPHTGIDPLIVGWRYLLCSDGLADELDLDDVEAAICDDDLATVQTLFERAMQGGGRDNISILLVRIEDVDDSIIHAVVEYPQ